jgi:hypothetical protein
MLLTLLYLQLQRPLKPLPRGFCGHYYRHAVVVHRKVFVGDTVTVTGILIVLDTVIDRHTVAVADMANCHPGSSCWHPHDQRVDR